MLRINDMEIAWLGHDSFRIKGEGQVIYIDPWKLSSAQKATLVLVTHEHYDHCSPEDVESVSGKNTLIVTAQDCAKKLKGTVKVLAPGQSLTAGAVHVEAVAAYNIDKGFHKKESGWLGFVLTIGKTRIYHAGDTDFIPEMRHLKAITVALLPVSGTYVMTAEQAAEAARAIGAEISVPMHFGEIVGSQGDAERFKALCEGLRVEILEKES